MTRQRIMISTKLALALAACYAASGPVAKACVISHASTYRSAMNESLAGSISPQAMGQAEAASAGGDASAQHLVGMWQGTATSGGQVVDQFFELFHSDGTEEILDITPPAEENACFGVWVQTAHDTAKLKHLSWTFDANGNLTGTAVLQATITIAHGENKFTGTYTLDYYDTSGNLTSHFTGQVQATRITPD